MEDIVKNSVLINKEDVINLKFPKEEVLNSSDEIKIRRMELERATTLGNAEHGKIKIFFHEKFENSFLIFIILKYFY